MKIIKENFNSINELLSTLDSRPNNNVFEFSRASEKNDYDFTLTNNYQEAKDLFINGYTEILSEIKSGINSSLTEKNKSRPINSVYGFVPHVPNAIQNLPNSMINIKKVDSKIKSLNIIYCPVASGGTDTDVFIDNGIKVLNIINHLEMNKIRVKLTCSFKASACGNESTLATLTLKNYNEQLNLQKICFPIAHPSFLRRIGFKWIETTKEIKEHAWNSGYGKSLQYEHKALKKIKQSLHPTEKLLLLHDIRNMNEDEILKMLLK